MHHYLSLCKEYLSRQYLCMRKDFFVTWVMTVFFFFILYLLKAYRDRSMSTIPLGYDPGIYKHIGQSYRVLFQQYWISFFLHINELSTLAKQHEPWWGLLMTMFWWLHIWQDSVLSWVRYMLAHWSLIPMWYILYAITKSKKILLILAIMTLLSTVHYQTFILMYYKQLIALWFGILWWIGLSQTINKNHISYLRIISLAWLILFHRHTALFFVLSYIVWYIIDAIMQRRIRISTLWQWIIWLSLWLVWYIPFRFKTITPYIQQVAVVWHNDSSAWYFLSWWEYVQLDVVYILGMVICITISAYRRIRLRSMPHIYIQMIIVSTVIASLWTIFQLINYKRELILLSALCILWCTYVIYLSLTHKSWWLRFVSLVFIIIQGLWRHGYYDIARTYFIDQQSLEDIQMIDKYIPSSGIVWLSSSKWTPWVIWYGKREKQISPGLSDYDVRTRPQWAYRWNVNPQEKCFMIQQDYAGYNLYARVHHSESKSSYFANTCYEHVYSGKVSDIYRITYKMH